ncbi:MAG TPA: VIT1/CCC1 transporter family protein [Polyangia bacterium]
MSARESWGHEMESVFLYRVVADAEPAEDRRALFRKLAGEAEAQAAIWADEIQKTDGRAPDAYVPATRARIVAALVRRFGPRRMKSVLAAMKVRGMSIYSSSAHPAGHPMPHSVDEIGQRHRGGIAGGNLRAAVFGASDGLVSNVCLILGVAGAAGGQGHTVLVSGVAGLLAGAFSMAAGEYVSVRSQREMFEYQIGAERDELAKYPDQEAAELSLIYQARGLGKDDADRMSSRIVANPHYALDTLAREELGLDPGALGSPVGAAAISFAAFAVGAAVPLAPFVFSSGAAALVAAIVLTSVALFGVGCATSLFAGRGAARGGLRSLLIGAAAGAVTFGIGRLLGAVV